MLAQSILSEEEKRKIKFSIPKYANKIFTATLARVYYAYPDSNDWSDAGFQGGLAFTRDAGGNLRFKLVDLDGMKGVIWERELYNGIEYFEAYSHFHYFKGDGCMIGLAFYDEAEAKVFFKKVNSSRSDTSSKHESAGSKKKDTKGGKIDKSIISGPAAGSFRHVAHMGYDAEKGFSSGIVDPSWNAFLGQLESQGITREVIAENMDFIKDFMRDAQKRGSGTNEPKKQPPPRPVLRRNHVNGSASIDSQASIQPPQPPPAPVISSRNIDPSWNAFLGQLESQGIAREVIAENMDFIKDFVRDAQKRGSGTNGTFKEQPRPRSHSSNTNGASAPSIDASKQPLPAPAY